MRRALKRGRVATILLVGTAGYLLGNWHVLSLRSANPSPGLSPAQSVALRFPEVQVDAAVADTVSVATSAVSPINPTGPTRAMVLGSAQLALLSPEPMVGRVVAQPEPQVAAPPAPAAPQPRAGTEIKSPPAMQRRSELKSLTESAVRQANRPGFVLNDAQIASIKGRLHLSPDQERMWPSVESALRSIAYAKAHDARRRGAAGSTDVASLDPDSAEVQGLKSAAFPLIMSFSDEQRNEVRSLAHVMGLDQLASQF